MGTSLLLDSPPDPDRTTAFLDNAGRSSVDSNRVEMPFADVAPQASELWSLDTGAELRVPIGRTGATKYQHLALGRGTPGLRTITVVAAGGSGLSARRALPALVLGSSVFLQLHLVLGLLLGPAARDAVDQAKGPALAAFAALVVLGALFWLLRRGRRQAGQAWTEASCPACLALNMVGERVSGLGRPAKAP